MTYAFCAFRISLMYRPAAGPCTLSFATTRWKTVQPLVVRSAAVADWDTIAMPADWKVGATARVSPENAVPTTPRNVVSDAILLASGVAMAGSPWVSKSCMVTWQFGFAALNFFTASLAPSRDGRTAPESPPENAPMAASLPPHLAELLVLELPDFWQPAASAIAAMITTPPSARR